MPTIRVEADLSPDDLLQAVDQMETPELDDFVRRVEFARPAPDALPESGRNDPVAAHQ